MLNQITCYSWFLFDLKIKKLTKGAKRFRNEKKGVGGKSCKAYSGLRSASRAPRPTTTNLNFETDRKKNIRRKSEVSAKSTLSAQRKSLSV